jgi:glyoxylase I family protein
MKFEHFALNVTDAAAHARWFVDHLGFIVTRAMETAPFTHFLADETGRVIVELYSNPGAEVPDYASRHPLVFHIAVATTDAAALRTTLEAAGAVFSNEDHLADGSHLVMLRDPWGVPLQLCQRATPFA